MIYLFKVFVIFALTVQLQNCASTSGNLNEASDSWQKQYTFSVPIDFGALYHLATISSLTYEDDKRIAKFCKQFSYECLVFSLEKSANRYLIVFDHQRKEQIIAIRGTANKQNVITDAEFIKSKDKNLGIKLHSGFKKSAEAILSHAQDKLKNDYRITVTGHSLGGADALILGMHLSIKGAALSEIVTFGQPKVTDAEGVTKFQNLPLKRVVNKNDIVPNCPPVELVYRNSKYAHFGLEINLLKEKYIALAAGNKLQSYKQASSFWDNLLNQSIWSELKEHYIVNYMESISSKLNKYRIVSFDKRDEYI